MEKAILLFTLLVGLLTNCSNPTTDQSNKINVKSTGVFDEILVEKETDAIKKLQDQSEKQKNKMIEIILKNPNDYASPVLYALSRELFSQGEKDEAAFWFYVGQLRARYDANLCMDISAREAVSVLNQEYGPDINKYTFQDLDKLENTVNRVVEFVRTNKENYDHRWINLHGMWPIIAGLSDIEETRPLSMPKDEWETIKKTQWMIITTAISNT